MNTIDLIELICSELTPTIKINSQETNDGIISLSTGCTYWITELDIIPIDGKYYKVVGLIRNSGISLSPINSDDEIEVTEFKLEAPTFKHGTLKMTKNEIDAKMDKEEITPLVWLQEPIRERRLNDAESVIDRNTELRIYILGSADTKNWLTEDHYNYILKPLETMVKLLVGKIENSRFFTEEFDYETTNLVNVSINGNQDNSIFDMNLSGIEFKLFAEIRKDLNCNSNNC